MIRRIFEDESLKVLVFVCLPLLLVLAGVIALFVRASRRTVKFQTFALSISRIGPHETYVKYDEQDRHLEFEAEIISGSSFFVPEIRVRMPSEMSGQELAAVVPNLTRGLEKLRYRYVIYRNSEAEAVSEEERSAAIAALKRMGVEIQSAPGSQLIQQAWVRDWRKAVGKHANTALPELLELIGTARGVRQKVQVLAQGPDKAQH